MAAAGALAAVAAVGAVAGRAGAVSSVSRGFFSLSHDSAGLDAISCYEQLDRSRQLVLPKRLYIPGFHFEGWWVKVVYW